MSDAARLVLLFFAAINPAAVALSAPALAPRVRRKAVAAGVLVAALIFGVAALGAEAFLEALAIAPETFRIAAGVAMGPSGLYAIFRARVASEAGDDSWRAGISPLALPLLVSPPALAAAISAGVDDGPGQTLAALAIPFAVAAGLAYVGMGRWRAGADGLARILGVLLIVLAVALIVDGVRAI